MRLILTTILFLALLPGIAAAQEPAVVTTGPADDVTHANATLTGTVDPNGQAREYRFEFGTTASYGLQTIPRTTSAGGDPEAVSAELAGLAPATTYHFRLVADGVAGADRTFRTAAAPTPPGITRLRASERTATSGRVSALIDPNGSATTWYVEWGLSTSFGNRTASQQLPAGTRQVPVTLVLAGLPSYQRIHWRVVAENAAGVRRSGRTSFTTLRAPNGVSLSLSPSITTWGREVAVSGTLRGAGVNGLNVVLQQSTFPFDVAFHNVATARTNRNGLFRFPARSVFIRTRFRVVPVIAPDLISPVRSVRVRSRVGIHRGRKTRRAVWLTGGVNPVLPTGLATLQRRTPSGWRSLAVAGLTQRSDVRSTYEFKVRRLRSRAAVYRVRVAAHDGGAHARGFSPAISVGKKQRKRRRG
jgi:hypothetical protein